MSRMGTTHYSRARCVPLTWSLDIPVDLDVPAYVVFGRTRRSEAFSDASQNSAYGS